MNDRNDARGEPPRDVIGKLAHNHDAVICVCGACYEAATRRTGRDSAPGAMLNYRVGIVAELGEVLDCLKKYAWHGKNDDAAVRALLLECGDVEWYLARHAFVCGVALAPEPPRIYHRTYSISVLVTRVVDALAGAAYTSAFHRPGTATIVYGGLLPVYDAFGFTVEQVRRENVKKLAARHPTVVWPEVELRFPRDRAAPGSAAEGV